MSRHGVEEAAVLRLCKYRLSLFARRGHPHKWCDSRKKVLCLYGVNQRESEQIALAGESRIATLESLFTHPPVRVCGNEVSLPDHVERARARLQRPERNSRHDLLVQIVLPGTICG